jgi:hypothetical protein
MATETKPNKSCRLGPAAGRRVRGTARDVENPILLTDRRTTCAISAVSDARVEAARLWLTGPDGKAVTKQDFISAAVDELTRQLLEEHADFKLPPSCAFAATPQTQKTGQSGADF